MKQALIFLLVCIVAITHQQFHQQRPRGILWWSPYDREDNIPFSRQLLRRPFSRPPPYFYENPNFNLDLTAELDGQNDMEGDGFPGAQSRIKGHNSSFQDSFYYNQQSNPRLLYPFGSASFYNPFFKTATFTLTSTLTLASIQSCVPANNFLAGVIPKSCRRKRSENDYFDEDQFPITPSETSKLETTATLPLRLSDYTPDLLSTSRDDTESTPDHHLREKRFFFVNKNQFVVSSTLTTYAFVNRTVTVTVNLLNPAPAADKPCLAAVAAVGDVQCVACLPAGYIVCP